MNRMLVIAIPIAFKKPYNFKVLGTRILKVVGYTILILFFYSCSKIENKNISTHENSCKNSHECFKKGVSEDKQGNLHKASILYQKSCDEGNALGCYNLSMLESSEKIPKIKQENKRNIASLNKIVCQGRSLMDIWKCCQGRDILECSSEIFCQDGDMKSCLSLGNRARDQGNLTSAEKWYIKACEGGVIQGCYIFGLVEYYEKGSLTNAKKWHKKACDGGHVSACYELNRLSKKQENFSDNLKKAYKRSCEKLEVGFEECYRFGLIEYYQNRDFASAKIFLKKACDGGHMPGCFNLGVVERKQGNLADAKIWWRKACNKGNREGCKALKSITEELQPRISGSGSGVYVSRNGHIITNEHVISGCSSVSVGKDMEHQKPAKIIKKDSTVDLGLLKVSSKSKKGNLAAKDAELGEQILVAGYPFLSSLGDSVKVTGGIISSTETSGINARKQFQMSAPIQPGNSGGPIYNTKGDIVGISISRLSKISTLTKSGSIPENINFGIKSSEVTKFLASANLARRPSNAKKTLGSKGIAKLAKEQTVIVLCYQ